MEAAPPTALQTGQLDEDERFSPQAQLEALLHAVTDSDRRRNTSSSARIGAGPERVLEKHRKQKLLVGRLRKALVRTRLVFYLLHGGHQILHASVLSENMSIVHCS